MQRMRVGVFFGGQSPEHEVSVISGLQAAAALQGEEFDLIPVYVSKNGRYFTGESLLELERYEDLGALENSATEISLAPGSGRTMQLNGPRASRFRTPESWTLDVVFLVFHGGPGENGAVQGLCEAIGVPYTGSSVLASALGMDKVRSKIVVSACDVPVLDFVEISEAQWKNSEENELNQIEAKIGFPAIVKPVRLGSSIGIARAGTREELDAAVEEAFRYDASILVERCIENLREINCSVLGNSDACEISVLEEPVSGGGLLSFKDKYMPDPGGSKGEGAKSAPPEGMASLHRIIPAQVPGEVRDAVNTMARAVFVALDCSGVARIDFLMDTESGEVFFNEINTIPGSLSFYLWKPTGLAFEDLVRRLIELAVERFETRVRRVRTYDVNLLAERSVKGLKGNKS